MTDDSAESSRSAEDSQDISRCQMEIIYYSLNGEKEKQKRGKAFRNRSDGELYGFESHDGILYRPGDVVYLETTQKEEPFVVASITSFKMHKINSNISLKVTRFFRPVDVPDISLHLVLQERSELCGEREREESIEQPHVRELFSSCSEAVASWSISSLRGKCEVSFVRDFRSLGDCDLEKENAFFSCLAYNQDSKRLASVTAGIRVGPTYQAKLPPEATCSVGDEPDRDELIYRPEQIEEHVEKNYIRLARSFRIFAMIDTRDSVEKSARVSDLLFDDSIATLHRCGYKYDQALREMNERDKLFAADAMFMTADDSKKFGKGLRTYGKNFVKINREMLPMHSRDQLVAYYYLWKKSSEATKPKPLRKQNTNTQMKKARNGQNKASRPNSTELNDYSSAGEEEVEKEGKTSQYACHHCYSSNSRDWHHAGKECLLLCTDCRLFFKKYGQLRPVDRPSTVPPCLFKRSPSGTEQEEESGVRTRAGKNNRRRTPSMNDERRSPSQAVSIHEFDLENRTKHKNGKRKKSHVNGNAKKRKLTQEEEGTPKKEIEETSENGREDDKIMDKMEEVMEQKTEPVKVEAATSDIGSIGGEIKEIKEIKEEVKAEEMEEEKEAVQEEPMEERQQTPEICDQQPSTSNSTLDGNESDIEPFDENEDNTWEEGDSELAFESEKANFVRRIVRKCGHRCARTDFVYRIKPGGAHYKLMKEREEKAKIPIVTTPTAAVSAVKKVENGLDASPRVVQNGFNGMNGLNLNLNDPNVIAYLMQAAQQQHQAQAQAQAQAAHAQLMEQQQQQQMLQQQRMLQIQQQQQQQQREAVSRMSMMPQFMDQRMAMPFMQNQQQQMELMAAQHLMQQMSGLPPGSAAMMPPEMQQMLLQQMMQQQQMMQNPMAAQMAQMGLHPQLNPNVLANSDMMRRLQQEAAMRQQP